jgi:hypothetical protein
MFHDLLQYSTHYAMFTSLSLQHAFYFRFSMDFPSSFFLLLLKYPWHFQRLYTYYLHWSGLNFRFRSWFHHSRFHQFQFFFNCFCWDHKTISFLKVATKIQCTPTYIIHSAEKEHNINNKLHLGQGFLLDHDFHFDI